MNEAVLVFPHQLFKQHPAIQISRQVYMLEEWLFFRQYNFHKQKLILHRSGMKFYEKHLMENNYAVEYIETTDERNDVKKLITFLSQQKITCIHIADVSDSGMTKRNRVAYKRHLTK